MKSCLYYTVSPDQIISIYQIVLDIPKLWYQLPAKNENHLHQINIWLQKNGYTNRGYNLIRL